LLVTFISHAVSFVPVFAPFARWNILPHTASLYKSFSALLLFT